jgi:hypothetical protein
MACGLYETNILRSISEDPNRFTRGMRERVRRPICRLVNGTTVLSKLCTHAYYGLIRSRHALPIVIHLVAIHSPIMRTCPPPSKFIHMSTCIYGRIHCQNYEILFVTEKMQVWKTYGMVKQTIWVEQIVPRPSQQPRRRRRQR